MGGLAIRGGLSSANPMLADGGYVPDRYLEVIEDKGITLCSPSRKNCKVPVHFDETRYRMREKNKNEFSSPQGLATSSGPL